MDNGVLIGIVGLLVTILGILGKLVRGQARLELKVELMWSAFERGAQSWIVGGRRRGDPSGIAHDLQRDSPSDE